MRTGKPCGDLPQDGHWTNSWNTSPPRPWSDPERNTNFCVTPVSAATSAPSITCGFWRMDRSPDTNAPENRWAPFRLTCADEPTSTICSTRCLCRKAKSRLPPNRLRIGPGTGFHHTGCPGCSAAAVVSPAGGGGKERQHGIKTLSLPGPPVNPTGKSVQSSVFHTPRPCESAGASRASRVVHEPYQIRQPYKLVGGQQVRMDPDTYISGLENMWTHSPGTARATDHGCRWNNPALVEAGIPPDPGMPAGQGACSAVGIAPAVAADRPPDRYFEPVPCSHAHGMTFYRVEPRVRRKPGTGAGSWALTAGLVKHAILGVSALRVPGGAVITGQCSQRNRSLTISALRTAGLPAYLSNNRLQRCLSPAVCGRDPIEVKWRCWFRLICDDQSPAVCCRCPIRGDLQK